MRGGVELPVTLRDLRYDGSVHPGAARGPVEGRANCQVFAYALLEHFGLAPPWLRSSELWADVTHTVRVEGEPAPLDLMLFHDTCESFGAHVGVFAGSGRVVHLARHHGRPVFETVDAMQAQPRYRVLIGVKRARGRALSPRAG